MTVYTVARIVPSKTSLSQVFKCGFDVLDFKEATLLFRITAVLGQSNLDVIPAEYSGSLRAILTRDQLKPHHVFVKRNSRFEIANGQIHRVFSVGECFLEMRISSHG